MITRNYFINKLNNHKSNQPLVLELKELTEKWQEDFCDIELNLPITYIRLNGKYNKAIVKKTFSQLEGINVTKVTCKHGKWKTIVHFEPISDSTE